MYPTLAFVCFVFNVGLMPSHGTETCAVTEAIVSYAVAGAIIGDPLLFERAEWILYNAYPAAVRVPQVNLLVVVFAFVHRPPIFGCATCRRQRTCGSVCISSKAMKSRRSMKIRTFFSPMAMTVLHFLWKVLQDRLRAMFMCILRPYRYLMYLFVPLSVAGNYGCCTANMHAGWPVSALSPDSISYPYPCRRAPFSLSVFNTLYSSLLCRKRSSAPSASRRVWMLLSPFYSGCRSPLRPIMQRSRSLQIILSATRRR